MTVNKSLCTNALAVAFIAASYVTPLFSLELRNVGLYALSGAVTNWLAIYMLFERIPGLYGSGIIPNKFEEFKSGIRDLIMGEFFTAENLERFITSNTQDIEINIEPLIDSLDYQVLFDKLKSAVLESPFGPMINMMGGADALNSVQESFTQKMREAILEISKQEPFQRAIQTSVRQVIDPDKIIHKIEHIVHSRLEELTPKMVKEIIQKMIREHLGWLVVWGGLFGGLIGFMASFTF